MNLAIKQSKNVRVMAAWVIKGVVKEQKSLSQLLPQAIPQVAAEHSGLLHELVAGSLRWWWPLQNIVDAMLAKPLRNKDFDVYCLMIIGIYQLKHLRIPDHAVVSETVQAATDMGKPWANKLINAVLRRFLREQDALTAKHSLDIDYSHPKWMIDLIQRDWPQYWAQILQANNHPADFIVRTNQQKTNRHSLIKALAAQAITAIATEDAPQGLRIESATGLFDTPPWQRGHLSVQGQAAQLAAYMVDLTPGMRVLDACAAPGGKTCHLLEREPKIQLLALEKDPLRIERLQQNLKRLGLYCETKVADATDTQSWWRGEEYDLVMIDAPCSGSGVIRKHPDIKHLRQASDIEQMVAQQTHLLEQLWPVLKTGGKLMYLTCSIFAQENQHQAQAFLQRHQQAQVLPLSCEYGLDTGYGHQRLPGVHNSDGFYYACFEKLPL